MIQSWKAIPRSISRGVAYDPWTHADNIGLQVLCRPLNSAHELWLPEYDTIVVSDRLTAWQQRVVLTHGLGHAFFAHEDDRPKHESQADLFAAFYLLNPDEVADASTWCCDERELARELGVTLRVFRAYMGAVKVDMDAPTGESNHFCPTKTYLRNRRHLSVV